MNHLNAPLPTCAEAGSGELPDMHDDSSTMVETEDEGELNKKMSKKRHRASKRANSSPFLIITQPARSLSLSSRLIPQNLSPKSTLWFPEKN